jgi:hypothetical protein
MAGIKEHLSVYYYRLTMYGNQTTNCNLPTLKYGFVPHHEVVEQTAQYIPPPESFYIYKRNNVR